MFSKILEKIFSPTAEALGEKLAEKFGLNNSAEEENSSDEIGEFALELSQFDEYDWAGFCIHTMDNTNEKLKTKLYTNLQYLGPDILKHGGNKKVFAINLEKLGLFEEQAEKVVYQTGIFRVFSLTPLFWVIGILIAALVFLKPSSLSDITENFFGLYKQATARTKQLNDLEFLIMLASPWIFKFIIEVNFRSVFGLGKQYFFIQTKIGKLIISKILIPDFRKYLDYERTRSLETKTLSGSDDKGKKDNP